jgi:hypothetical protein
MKINLFHHIDSGHIEAAAMKNGLRLTLVAAGLMMLLACAGCGGGSISVGDTGVTIDEVEISDRFPPDCEEGTSGCTMSEGYEYLILWLEGGSLPGTATITDSSGERFELGGGLWMGRIFLAQRVPEGASGFTLYVSGVEPIDLGK